MYLPSRVSLANPTRASDCIDPECWTYQGDDPLAYVVSLNLKRRHLDSSQRGMVAAKLADLTRSDSAILRHHATANLQLHTRSEAGKLLNISERTVNTAKKVQREGSDELIQAVESGNVSVSAAADVSDLPKPEQIIIVAKGEREILTAAKDIRTEKPKKRKKENDEIRRKALSILPPAGLYRCIVIDPPWPMKHIPRDVRPRQIDLEYPTMTIEEIREFKIPAADECHLFLWTTHKFLPAAFDVLKAWGFNYIFTMVWHKPGGPQPFNLPQYNCEFVLFARRGKLGFNETPARRKAKLMSTFFL